jgi:hypothetical protein
MKTVLKQKEELKQEFNRKQPVSNIYFWCEAFTTNKHNKIQLVYHKGQDRSIFGPTVWNLRNSKNR